MTAAVARPTDAMAVFTGLSQLPVTLSIGTQAAFKSGYKYDYRFVDEIQMYLCDSHTTTGVTGEVMAIQGATDPENQMWYVAWEGQMDGSDFRGRQMAFRTQERFWEPGTHVWQLNANNSGTNTDNTTWQGNMSAITKVPQGVDTVTAAVDVLHIPDARAGGDV